MGAEAACTVRYAGRSARGTALLETDALIFRGPVRLAIPYREMRRVDADGEALVVTFPGGTARFELGAKASAWADRIRHPKGRLDKLGVTAATEAALLGRHDPVFVREVSGRARRVLRGRLRAGVHLIFLAADTPAALRRLEGLSRRIAPDGGIWVIVPRGSSVVPESAVLRAGKAAGLVDVKVARFSETQTAHKFVIPRAARPARRAKAAIP